MLMILGLFLSTALFAQSNNNGWFNSGNNDTQQQTQDEVVEEDPGGPADPVPINDYLPILLVVGIGIIAYTAKRTTDWKNANS